MIDEMGLNSMHLEQIIYSRKSKSYIQKMKKNSYFKEKEEIGWIVLRR